MAYGMAMDALPNIPEPPGAMKLRVQPTRRGTALSGFHTFSTNRHYIEKGWRIFIGLVMGLMTVGGPLYWMIVPMVFFQQPVIWDDNAIPMPRLAVLTLVVPFLLLIVLMFGYATVEVLRTAVRMTPDRTDWSVEVSEKGWRVTRHLKHVHSDNTPENRVVDPHQISQIGTNLMDEVYARTNADVVPLTTPLSPAEAAWVEKTLASLLPVNAG